MNAKKGNEIMALLKTSFILCNPPLAPPFPQGGRGSRARTGNTTLSQPGVPRRRGPGQGFTETPKALLQFNLGFLQSRNYKRSKKKIHQFAE